MSSISSVLAICLCLTSQVVHAIEGTDGYLLATKEFSNDEVVSGHDLTIEYTLYNVGDSDVVDVALSDDALNAEPFVIVSGSSSAQFAAIPAGSSATHSVVVKPMISANEVYDFGGAKVSYKASSDSDEVQKATSSAPGLIELTSYEDFARANLPHYAEWTTFGMLCLIPIGIPYYMYTNSVASLDVKKEQ